MKDQKLDVTSKQLISPSKTKGFINQRSGNLGWWPKMGHQWVHKRLVHVFNQIKEIDQGKVRLNSKIAIIIVCMPNRRMSQEVNLGYDYISFLTDIKWPFPSKCTSSSYLHQVWWSKFSGSTLWDCQPYPLLPAGFDVFLLDLPHRHRNEKAKKC